MYIRAVSRDTTYRTRIHARCSQIHQVCISATVATHTVISVLQNLYLQYKSQQYQKYSL